MKLVQTIFQELALTVRGRPLTDNRPPFEVSRSADLCHDDGIITGHNRLHIEVS
jgi:hypothetical protein